MGCVSPERRSANMRAIRSKDMKPEMLVRRIVHSMGYRYRLHQYDLPGRPDLVFKNRRKIIFINGCFWHQHSAKACKITHKPKSNLAYWLPKLEKTIERDKKNKIVLRKMGWKVLVIWECQIKDQNRLYGRIKSFLEP